MSESSGKENLMNRYLIDTSVWIDFFRGRSEVIKNRIFKLLDENAVFTNGIILAELLIGASGRKEFDFIKDNFEGLRYMDMDRGFFIHLSEVGNALRRSGTTIPLSDLAIITQAKKNKLIVFTRDRHFESLGKNLNFQYEIPDKF